VGNARLAGIDDGDLLPVQEGPRGGQVTDDGLAVQGVGLDLRQLGPGQVVLDLENLEAWAASMLAAPS